MHLKIITTILLRPQCHLSQICSSPSFMHLISKQRRNFIHICPYRIRYYCKNVTKSFTFMNICIVFLTSPYLLVNRMRSAFNVHQCFVFTQAVPCSRVLPVQFYHRRKRPKATIREHHQSNQHYYLPNWHFGKFIHRHATVGINFGKFTIRDCPFILTRFSWYQVGSSITDGNVASISDEIILVDMWFFIAQMINQNWFRLRKNTQ